MKNAKVGERVRMYVENSFSDGEILDVLPKRLIKIKFDDGIDSIEHESQLIRLRKKNKVTRKQLESWAKEIDEDGCWSKKAVITSLCELLGIK